MALLRTSRLLRLHNPSSTARALSTAPEPPTPLPAEQPTAVSPTYLQQSPNVPHTWSTNQNPKPHAFANVRFEQTSLRYQPNRPSAMGMVNEDPVRLVQGRRAVCDGGEYGAEVKKDTYGKNKGGGALGHPKIYINLDKPGPKACGYCSIRFEQAHEEH
nr:NADH dehydrogenase (ubiquinone) Fe-S protein 6 [Cryptococcus depauperatus CBS 7841]